ncbi:MAG TPA: UDP-N-acetylmuramoyl-L-alanyl-D-glutamate--2,6-diaminopimelate ligase, partial [Ruminococcaceae bacterium]|nr:UDP-N-acetylmuramoyl-L-alanyl-D-glutamate--2,6-diaminopimelate ligase [Oscillospiraceae bacterium]
MEEYAKAKAILMQNSSVCIINADDSYAEMMKRNAAEKVVTYAVDGNADIKAENVKLNHGGVVYTLVCENGRYEIAYDVIGK